MRVLLSFLFASVVFGQISGVGQLGCNGAPVTGTGWTSGTAGNTTQAIATKVPVPFIQVELQQTSTITGGAVTWLGDPGDGTFINVPVAQVVAQNTWAQLTNPYTLIASTNQIFIINMSGFVSLQLKLTTVISGTATVTPITTPVCYTPQGQLSAAGKLLVDASGVTLGALSNNGAAAGANRVGTLPGIAQTSYNNGTASTQGRDVAANIGTDGMLWTASLPSLRPASYTASANFAASSTTDNSCIVGNATNKVLVTEVRLSGIQTTAGIINVALVKRSAADTGGTSANMTSVPDDAGYAAASTTPITFTGTGPAVGAAVGNIDNFYLAYLAAGTASPADIYIGNFRMKPIVLNAAAQVLCLNNGGALTGGNMSVTWKWIETANITE